MKILRSISILFLVLILTSAFTTIRKKDSQKPVYVMGVSLCFGDSVVYFTEIQQMDSVRLTREGFLPNREGYSDQLQYYLQGQAPHQTRTCVTYFSEKKQALQKTLNKLTKRYQMGVGTVVQRIAPEDFRFVRPTDEY